MQTPQRREHYMSKCVLGLSITQIITGALCVLSQVVLIYIHSRIDFVGLGIWAGLFFVLTGSFGIVSSRWKTTCFIVTYLILTIISAAIAIGIIIMSCYCITSYNSRSCVSGHEMIGIYTVLIITALVQLTLAIISSAFSCQGVCGGNQNQAVVMAGQVQYVQGQEGQQQMVIQPFSQHGAGLPSGPSLNPVQNQLPANDLAPPPQHIRVQ